MDKVIHARPEKSAYHAANASAIDGIYAYHQRSKHRLEAYARGPETLDWDSQPNPFRTFAGSDKLPLPLEANPSAKGKGRYESLFADAQHAVSTCLSLGSLAHFLRLSLGLSAWKEFGPDKWSLRVNPSSGNLHPTETYLFLPAMPGLSQAGLYHYDVASHQLELRASHEASRSLAKGLVLGFSSVLWREAWKYGERSFRYCQLDQGHALASVVFAAKVMGWQVAYLKGMGSEQMAHAMGLDRAEYQGVEKEIPELLLYIAPELDMQLAAELQTQLPATKQWFGQPNKLGGRTFYKWPIVDEMAKLTACVHDPACPPEHLELASFQAPGLDVLRAILSSELSDSILPYEQLAQQRRSAQAYHKQTLSLDLFRSLVASLLWRLHSGLCRPFAKTHLLLMVHRVEGIKPGVYLLPRSAQGALALAAECRSDPHWQSLNLFEPVSAYANQAPRLLRLDAADMSRFAGSLCCHQAIAHDCSFTIGFIAEFDEAMRDGGVHAYRTMHWQAGILAQQAYLHASAHGVAATGIGCFFDDLAHDYLGIETKEMQLLYQMAVGFPKNDARLVAHPAYHHLSRVE